MGAPAKRPSGGGAMKAKLTIALVVASRVFLAAAVFAVATGARDPGHSRPLPSPRQDRRDRSRPVGHEPGLASAERRRLERRTTATGRRVARQGHGPHRRPADQIRPRVSDTDPGQPDNHVLVVWEDHHNGDADIYGYDMTTGKCSSSAPGRAAGGAADLGRLGRLAGRPQRQLGHLRRDYRPATTPSRTATPICDESHDQIEPDVSGDTVVWVDARVRRRDIMGYDRRLTRSRSA